MRCTGHAGGCEGGGRSDVAGADDSVTNALGIGEAGADELLRILQQAKQVLVCQAVSAGDGNRVVVAIDVFVVDGFDLCRRQSSAVACVRVRLRVAATAGLLQGAWVQSNRASASRSSQTPRRK